MSRIQNTFHRLKAEGRKALITFTMAGDPDQETSLAILHRLAQSADILEIGMPFTDPMADGPAVQAAGLRALKNSTDLKSVFSIVQKFRSINQETPIVLMGYFNPVLQYGPGKFSNDCKSLGVDGVIIVDLPPEEAGEVSEFLQQNSVDFIRLLTPTTREGRLKKILKNASGFLYYVSITGVTGTASADTKKVKGHIQQFRQYTDLPIVAGFGIRTAENARDMAAGADGVVVGSALVHLIEQNPTGDLSDILGAEAALLAQGVKSV